VVTLKEGQRIRKFFDELG